MPRWYRAEPIQPTANDFLADIDAAFMQKIFDVTERTRNRMYSITAKRMVSGLVLKYLNKGGWVMPKRYETPLIHSSEVNLTRPSTKARSRCNESYKASSKPNLSSCALS